MTATPSSMMPLGSQAHDFTLINYNPNYDKQRISLSDYKNKSLLIAFICNHCPYVIHIMPCFAKIANQALKQGIAVVAINSNDIERYPADHPDKMSDFATQYQLDFPYCFDDTQEIARHYQAACTPDFFLFDSQHCLRYRGQFDASRPKNAIPTNGDDLQDAISALLNHQPINQNQVASLGCNIKWKQ